MIVSASRRTDIPAFFLPWMLERLAAGWVEVPNPYNPRVRRRVELSPEEIDCIVFWSKNPAPLLGHLEDPPARDPLSEVGWYLLYTINSYGADLEPGLPAQTERIETFRRLAGLVGPERLVWRYDPIVLTPAYDLDFHKSAFETLAGRLEGSSGLCITSFYDAYRKCAAAMRTAGAREPDDHEAIAILQHLAQAAGTRGMELCACAEERDASGLGVRPSRCIDAELASRLSRRSGAALAGKDRRQRPACHCAASVDIGSYGSCLHGCLYCYAR